MQSLLITFSLAPYPRIDSALLGVCNLHFTFHYILQAGFHIGNSFQLFRRARWQRIAHVPWGSVGKEIQIVFSEKADDPSECICIRLPLGTGHLPKPLRLCHLVSQMRLTVLKNGIQVFVQQLMGCDTRSGHLKLQSVANRCQQLLCRFRWSGSAVPHGVPLCLISQQLP